MVEHRVPVLNGALHRAVDPAHSSDPRVRAVVAALDGLPVTPPPREHFRAELRAQLVAVTPRLVNEGMEGLVRHTPETFAQAHARPSPLHLLKLRVPHVRLARPVRLATAALAVIALIGSGVVWLSRSALPGDPLYNVKRASENAQLSLESGSGKADQLLALAKTRAGEVADLLSIPTASGAGPQAGGAISAHTAALITSTLGSADSDVEQAASLLGTQAVHKHSATPLQTMIGWAPGQEQRLDAIVAHIPAGTLHDRAVTSRTLVQSAFSRAEALRADLVEDGGCACLGSAGTDRLGPLPCGSCTMPSPQLPTPGASTGAPGTSAGPATGTHPHAQPGGQDHGSTPVTGSGGTSSTAPGGGLVGVLPTSPLPTSGLPALPTLPLPSIPTPSKPVAGTGSCGATVNLGPIGIGVGTCGVHVRVGG